MKMNKTAQTYDVVRIKDANRQRSGQVYTKARDIAARYGLELTRITDRHYKLKHPAGWIKCLYPSSQQVWAPPSDKGPFLLLPEPWTLLDVVNAAIAADARKET